MSDDNIILLAVLSLFGSLGLTVYLTRWRNKKGKTSVYAADTSMEDVGLSALMTLGTGKASAGVDGRLIMRPPFGTGVIGPVVAAIILATFDFGPLLASLGLVGAAAQRWIYMALWALLAYTFITLNFRQRVVVDGDEITCAGVQLTTQTRDLADLVDISVHPQRPALVLTFANQDRLYIPKFLTGRDTFVALMEEVAAGNRAMGLSPPPEGLLARAGF